MWLMKTVLSFHFFCQKWKKLDIFCWLNACLEKIPKIQYVMIKCIFQARVTSRLCQNVMLLTSVIVSFVSFNYQKYDMWETGIKNSLIFFLLIRNVLLLVTSQQRSSPKIGKKRDNVIVCFFFGKQIGKITVSFFDTHVYFHWLTAINYVYLHILGYWRRKSGLANSFSETGCLSEL